jgi:hypothetical protein
MTEETDEPETGTASIDGDAERVNTGGEREGTTVVLGWDALDYDLVEAFDLGEAFGPHYREIETFDNPTLGEPHTKELWPSMITGVTPDVHGLHAVSEGGPSWENPVIAAASRLARGVVPEEVRTRIGRVLRNRGAGFSQATAEHYAERGVSTVFDGRTARPIALPNYHVDDGTAYLVDRGSQLEAFLSINEDTNTPKTTLPRLEERLLAETEGKLGAVHAAIQREYDIVFVWLSVIDTVGHLAPVVADRNGGWQERIYRVAAAYTEGVKDRLRPEDTLVCVSDHGLQGGDHTHSAFIGASEPGVIDDVESVTDVRTALESVTPSRGSRPDPPVREAFQYDRRDDRRDASEVRGQLEDLGYL